MLLKDDLHYILERIPKDIIKMMQSRFLVLGGGSVRSLVARELVSDYDLFGCSKENLEHWARGLAFNRKGRIYKTDNAITVLSPPRTPVQFITRWLFQSPVDIANSFDFTVCQAVVWWEPDGTGTDRGKWLSYTSPEFYPDLAARRLRYTAPRRNEDAGGSMLRVVKYMRRGYGIAPESLGKVIARLVGSVRLDVLLMHDEETLATIITALLREVDPLTIIDGLDILPE